MKRFRIHVVLVVVTLLAFVLAACGQSTTGGAGGAATQAPAGEAATSSEATGMPEKPTQAPALGTTPSPDATGEQPTAATSGAATGTIKVGSKDFTEEFIVAELYAHLLEHAGFTVERKLNLGGTPIAHMALVEGEIDLYPEYTSTGLQEVLQIKETIKDRQQIFERVKSEYEKQFNVTWLEPSPFNDTNTFATTREIADRYGLKTYSDLAAKAPELRLGGPAEFPDRQDTKGLEEAYGPFVGTFKEFVQLGTGSLRYDALQNGDVDVVVAFGTDGRIKADNLVVLQDDKSFYPIYNIAPVVRMDTLQKYPQIADVLNKLAPLLTDDVMSGLNYQVDGPEAKEPADVARAFLEQEGLLTQ